MFATLLALAVLAFEPAYQQENQEWKLVKSHDGKVQALLPGEAKENTEYEDTLAGRVTTRTKEFRTGDAQFTVSSTVLPTLARTFAKDSKILKSTKEGILKKFYGKETGYKSVVIDGVKGAVLTYDAVDFDDPEHMGYQGVTFMGIRDGTLYTANAVIKKDSGQKDLQKFRDSIKFQK